MRSDAVTPVIAIGKTTAGPADDRGIQRRQRFHKRFTDAANVGDAGLFSDPNSVINDTSNVLRKVAEKIRVHSPYGFIQKYFNSGCLCAA